MHKTHIKTSGVSKMLMIINTEQNFLQNICQAPTQPGEEIRGTSLHSFRATEFKKSYQTVVLRL